MRAWSINALVVYISAAMAAAAVFSNSLNGQFVIDDGSAVRTNQDLRPETPLWHLLRNDFWGRPIAAAHSVKSYRPLTVLTFRANFAWHGLAVEGYHAVNVMLHAMCSALVGMNSLALFAPGDIGAACVSSLAFAIHPVHTEAVASVVGRAELLCCMCFLLCLLSRHSASQRRRGVLGSVMRLLVAAAFAVLATGSKETGITAPAVAAALDLLAAMRASATQRDRALCMLRCAFDAALVALLFGTSLSLRGEQLSPYFSFVDNPLPSLSTRASRVMSALHIHVRYARLLLWPATLSADYSFDCVPAVTELTDTRNLAAAALYAGLGWLGLASLMAHRTSSCAAADDAAKGTADGAAWRAAGRALVVLLLPMIPASHALLGIGTLIAERLLYIPSVGYCLLLGVAASAAMRPTVAVDADAQKARGRALADARSSHHWTRAGVVLALLCAAGLGCARTRTRNLDWSNSDSITNATARACPGSAKAMLSLGTMHLQRKEHEHAHRAFRAALRIHPTYCDALHWLGRLAFMEGRLHDAEPLLHAALEINVGHPEANLFAALCAARRNDDGAALLLMSRAHDLAPHNAEIVRDYGAMLLRANQPKQALKPLRRAVGMLSQLYLLGDHSLHARGALASAQVKLAAALLRLNKHAECLSAVDAAVTVESGIEKAIDGLRRLCERGRHEGLDTSGVKIDLAL